MALKNIMRVDNGNVIYTGGSDGTEAKNFINNNLITSVNGTDVEFKFIYDSTQDKFGYRDASGTFVPFESGGDFSQLIYENLAAANIKKGVTINVKDPDGNVLNSATGSYEVNTFTNLTAANVKKDVTVTIKDSNNTSLKTVTGSYTVNTFTNLISSNIKKNVTITIKDSAGTTIKTLTGTFGTHTATGSRSISGNNVTVTASIDGTKRASATASFYSNTDSGNVSFKYNSSDTTSHTARVTGTWSSSDYIVYVYVDGSVKASKTFSQYDTGSFSATYSG